MLLQQWQALVSGLDPQSLAQYLHNMQLLTADAATPDGGVAGGWLPQRDAGSPLLPPYMAQAAAGQLGGYRADRAPMACSTAGVGSNIGSSLFGLPEQPQFIGHNTQPARLKGVDPSPGWLGNAEAAGVLGRMTPAFESPRSVDSAPVSPGPDLMRQRYAGGGSATSSSSFPTPVFPTPGARFSPQPSPRGGSGGHRAATAPVHPSPLAHSSGSGGSGSGLLETPLPLPQSTGTGFFCPAVSATAPRSRGPRSNRQRAARDAPASSTASTTSDAGMPASLACCCALSQLTV